MKQSEILDLAMERIIQLMQEPEVDEEEHKLLQQKLRTLARLFVYAENKERKK